MTMREFIDDVRNHLKCDRPRAEAITFVVLRALRGRLTPKEVIDVRAQLPADLKRMWDENRGTAEAPQAGKHLNDLLSHVRSQATLPNDEEAERAVRAVFRALQTLLASPTGAEGEAWDIFSVIPKDWRKLWLSSARSPAPEALG